MAYNIPAEWDVNGAGDPHIQGFASPFSVLPSQTIQFRVRLSDAVLLAANVTDPSHPRTDLFRIDVYRLGFYAGRGARRIVSLTQAVRSGVVANTWS